MLDERAPRKGHRNLLLGLILASLALALLMQLHALYGLAAMLAIYLLVARVMSRTLLVGLDAERQLYPSAFEGDTVDVTLWIANRGNRRLHLLEVFDRFGPSLAGRQALLEPGPLLPRHRRRLTYKGACGKQWGVHDCGPITLAASDPMGLFRVEADVLCMESFAVFPRVHEVAGLDCRGSRASLVPQLWSRASPGRGALSLGIREFQSGDELRRMHWKATASHGRPMVRELELELEPWFSLFVDLDENWRAGMGLLSTSEFVVRTAACLLWTAMGQGAIFQVFGMAEDLLLVEPGQGQQHLTRALHELIHRHRGGRTPLLDVVDAYRSALPRGSTVALLSATIELDLARTEQLLEEMKAAELQPVVIAVNNFSFRQVERFLRPAEERTAMLSGLEALLERQGVQSLILTAPGPSQAQPDDLAVQLERGIS